MKRVCVVVRLLARAGLLAVLLAAQTIASAHDLEHLGAHGNSLCTVCAASHATDAAAPAPAVAEIRRPWHQPPFLAVAVLQPQSAPSPFQARAPPGSL